MTGPVPAHVLATNDFPPKVGGIQSYLWELWRRLPSDAVTVHTSAWPGADEFDAAQPFPIQRDPRSVLLPTPGVARRIRCLVQRTGAQLVVLDPALPLGLVGPRLDVPYAVVAHGAEITVPGRVPVGRAVLARVLSGARLVVAAGHYPLAEAERAVGRQLPSVVVPPGVDVDRFRPLSGSERRQARRHHGLPEEGRVVLSVSRLVPRKGMDVAVEAAARLAADHPDVCLAIAGSGRDRARLERQARRAGAPVRFLGRVTDDELPRLYGSADVFAMLCRNRWAGLEQEGFGIVFLEAAAAGVPAVAGDSGGAAEAVVDGVTGVVVDRPDDPAAVARALAVVLDDEHRRAGWGEAGRRRAVDSFSYDHLAGELAAGLAGVRA